MPDEYELYKRVSAEAPRNVQHLELSGYSWNDDFARFEKPHPDHDHLIWTIDLEEARGPFHLLRALIDIGGTLHPRRT